MKTQKQITKKMFILMSHTITSAQKSDAIERFNVSEFIVIPSEQWGQIPADADSVCNYTSALKIFLNKHANKGDILLVQGDFGATINMVHFAFQQEIIPVYATTKRSAKEIIEGDKITTVREFRHVRFRIYETQCLKLSKRK